MRFPSLSLVACLLPAVLAVPASQGDKDKHSFEIRDGVKHNVFYHANTRSTISFVKNSGICETTPNVNQYSGYLKVGEGMNMWFWFFESRKDPATAPFAAWLNGGPGCSSMIGLFQENGPCQFYNGESKPRLNRHSFNQFANMIYIDQPVGVGFSYGNEPVNSTVSAAPYVWNLLQAFYAAFPTYVNRDFGIFTESYGGHYAPALAHYLQKQNAKIDAKTVQGKKINLVALGINNGYIDPAISHKALIDYAYSNSYGPLITKAAHANYHDIYSKSCLPRLKECTTTTGSDAQCIKASEKCYEGIEGPILNGNYDIYDIRQPINSPYPPIDYVKYLHDPAVIKAIGANPKIKYHECSDNVGNRFGDTGDDSRSFLADLSAVVRSGVHVLIWAGDADVICNWFGNLEVANSITYPGTHEFNLTPVQNYTVMGVVGGTFKTVDNLSWLRVLEAGHEVAYYTPALALQVFKQTFKKKAIFST
ncbi:hypothetical protein DSL72_007578 [Monilinia vaccinii-corymbosi]|uniref:Carboxypeptidase n=1 Tax=Monilinia vaccinii-corymbosi TaxID=61207 RepID=A0A8A3PI64_9HELO|nr:hypothetical protein DSL72_007578 [Monilinia vaccinii-corymbosi]